MTDKTGVSHLMGSRSPETYLWRTVIMLAISDGDRPWFERDHPHFRLICHLANLDPDAVRESALRQLGDAKEAA